MTAPANNDVAPDSNHDKISDALSLLVLCSAILAIAGFLIHQLYSFDVWWQVAIGRDILESGSIPVFDRYTVAGLGRPYHDSHWLFQVVLALFHRLGGMVGVQMVMVIIWSLIFHCCYRACRHWTTVYMSSVLLLFTAMACTERFLVRPDSVTVLMIIVFYSLLQKGKYRAPHHWALLGALQAIWSNSHGLFVIGPFLVGCHWAAALVEKRCNRGSDFSNLSVALACVTLGTLVTPFGFENWRYAVLLFNEAVLGGSEVFQRLGELSPVFGSAARSNLPFGFFVLILISAIAAGILSVWHKRVSARGLIVLGLCLAGLTGRRNTVLFVIVAAPFIAEAISITVSQRMRIPKLVALCTAVAMLGWSYYPISGAYYKRNGIYARFGLGATPCFFPHDLPAFLDEIEFDGKIFNSNVIGGFYLYHGYPKRLPLTDGRWEVYEPAVLADIRNSREDRELWNQVVSRHHIEGLLLAHGSPEGKSLVPFLRHESNWRLVFYDNGASFWLPAHGRYARVPSVDANDPNWLPAPSLIHDVSFVNSFLKKMGAQDARLALLTQALEMGVKTESFLEKRGKLLLAMEKFEEAQEDFESLLRRDSKNKRALNELAFLAYRRGDIRSAVAFLKRAIAIDPEDAALRENLAQLRNVREEP